MNKYIPGILTECDGGCSRKVNIEYTFTDVDGVMKFKLLIDTEWLDCDKLCFCSHHLSQALYDHNLDT